MNEMNAQTETIQVAFNPITRKYEQVFPEDEAYETSITMYWSGAVDKYIFVS